MRMIRSSITRHTVIVAVIDNNAVIVVEARMIRSCHSHLDVFRVPDGFNSANSVAAS